MLQLRGSEKMMSKFNDKKTPKVQLWQEIAEEMAKMGFPIGLGKEGAEKVRQKFVNLQRRYMKFVCANNQAGNQKLLPPTHFEQLHSILGESYGVSVLYLCDDEDATEESLTESLELGINTLIDFDETPATSSSKESASSQQSAIVDTLKDLFHQQSVQQDKQFKCLLKVLQEQTQLFKEQNAQRAELISLLKTIGLRNWFKQEPNDSE